MSLYIFCLVLLSGIFSLVFGVWWDINAPFKIHLAALIFVMVTILSVLLMIAMRPVFSFRYNAHSKRSDFDTADWGSNISSKLSTPAAVLDGYNIAYANKSFLTEIGMAAMSNQVIGMPLTNLIHPRDHHNLVKFMAETAQDSQYNETIKLRILRSDGTTLPAYMSLSPLHEEQRSGLNLLQFSPTASFKNEISEEERKDYHLLFESIEQVVFQINVNQKIMLLSPSWEHFLDYAVKECIDKPLCSFIHPEDQPLVEARLNSLTQGKRTNCQIEARLIAKNGDSYWVEIRAKATSSIRNESSSVIGTLTDISRMKTTEASLRANRHSLSTLLSNIPGMIYRCKNDRNWSFEFASDGCLEVTGYEPYEMVGAPNFSFMQIIHPDDRSRAWDLVQQQVAKQEKFQLVYRIITRSGKVKWVWEQGRGVYSSSGELLALEGFITDIAKEENDNEDLLVQFQKGFELPAQSHQNISS